MAGFFEVLREQRRDDHRYYHHSRINQSLHLFSSLCFVGVYALLLANKPTVAALIGWFVAMISRQIGHFFFEPKDYDEVNQATHAYKESIKVGYNLKRKVVLLTLWAATPIALYADPTLFGLLQPHIDPRGFLDNLATSWLVLGIGAVAFRTVHLFFLEDVKTGLVWATKIVTDPFHDIMIYWRAPLQVLRGEVFAPRDPQRDAA